MPANISAFRALVAAAAVAGSGLAGCGGDDEQRAVTTPAAEASADQAGAATEAVDPRPANRELEALLGAPRQFLGERITVTGEADGATSAPAAFRIDRPRGDRGIVVLPTEQAMNANSIRAGQRVTVEGTVLEVTEDLADKADFQFETDDQASATLARVESDVVIAADRVRALGR